MFFDDAIRNYKTVVDLVKNFNVVQKEILDYVNDPNVLVDYPNYDVQDDKTIYDYYWKASPCSIFKDEHVEISQETDTQELLGYLVDQFRNRCPVTYSCIKEDEDNGVLCNSFISRLIPGSVINPHRGWTYNYLRVHLGIKTDPECKITVDGTTRTWEEGKILAFNDGDLHSVVHNGMNERIVFSFDLEGSHIDKFMASEKSS